MYKATIELAKINKMMKLKFGLIIRSDNEIKYPSTKLVNKFNYYGNDYIKISPNPFVVIDISSYMNHGEGYNTNQSVSLNRYYLFRFIQALRVLLKNFIECKNLFYYREDQLVVNDDLAEKLMITVHTGNSKTIRMRPCVVPDEENQEMVYEGCIFYINTMENFSYLTYTEMEYLLWELMNINMNELSMQIINTVKLFENQNSIEIKVQPSPQKENPMEVEMVSPSSFTIVKKDTIPKI